MMAGSDGPSAVAGGLARHVPVLGRPAIEFLNVREGGFMSTPLLAPAATRARSSPRRKRGSSALIATSGPLGTARILSRRPEAGSTGRSAFFGLDTVVCGCGLAAVDGVVLDIGVSSMQLDEAERGFSFRLEGPLDMRMGGRARVRQMSSLNCLNANLPRSSQRWVRSAMRAPLHVPSSRADRLRSAPPARSPTRYAGCHARPGTIHPATRTFQALRIFVNEELAELAAAFAAAERILKPSGRLVVIAFHSLEDRIVKSFLNDRARSRGVSRHLPVVAGPAATFRILTRRPIVPDDAEITANPRARSAKLRAAERTEAGPLKSIPPVPSLPDLRMSRRDEAAHSRSPRLPSAGVLRRTTPCVCLTSWYVGALVAAAYVDGIKFDSTQRLSAPPSCVRRSGASATPSPRCGRNGRSSTIRRGCRAWPRAICVCVRSRRRSSIALTGCPTPARCDPRTCRSDRSAPRTARRGGPTGSVPAGGAGERYGSRSASPSSRGGAGLSGSCSMAAMSTARQGEGAGRPRGDCLCPGYGIIAGRLIMFAATSESHTCAALPARMPSARHVPTSSIATARCWRPTCGRLRCSESPSDHRYRRSGRTADCGAHRSERSRVARAAATKRRFVWLRREITPKQQVEIHRLGIPGIGFLAENKRVYPNSAKSPT